MQAVKLNASEGVDPSKTYNLAVHHYSKSVLGLRNALEKFGQEPSARHRILWTTHLLGLFELMTDATGEGWIQHLVHGTSKALVAAGPASCKSGHGQRFFTEIRIFEVCRAIIFNEPTFLAKADWRCLTREMTGEEQGNGDSLDELLDIIVSCSTLRVRAINLLYHSDADSIDVMKHLDEAFDVAQEGFRLRQSLIDWEAKEGPSKQQTVENASGSFSALAKAFFAATSIYLSGVFDYEIPYWQEKGIVAPNLSEEEIRMHVVNILTHTNTVLSYEAESRRPRYPPSSSPRQSYYERPRRRDSGFRSVSPQARPPPPAPVQRALRRRMTRDSDWMSEDESRPTSRRRSPTPERRQKPRPYGTETPPFQHSPRPAVTRPPMRSYPTDSSRPDPRRRPSYEPPPSPRRPPGAGKRSPPSAYRPAPHLAADMLRGRPRSRGNSPPRSPETHDSATGRRPSYSGAGNSQPSSRRYSVKSPEQKEAKPTEKPAENEPKKKGFDFMKHFPQAVAAYAGIEALGKHADTAKEWTDWFMKLQKTPAEIHELSAKATTARDTITQIQNTLEARPDIIEGDDARPMRRQIDEAIRNATAALDEMTKLLQEISSDGLEGTMFGGLEEFYNSYRYKDEWEEKIKLADGELEKQLAALSTLMVNIYSRALMKPAPPGFDSPVPPPAPGQSSDSPDARRSSTAQHSSKSRAGSIDLDPPPVGRYRKSVDEDAARSAPSDVSTEPKVETAKVAAPEDKPIQPENDAGEPEAQQNTGEAPPHSPKGVKLKVDDDLADLPTPSPKAEPAQPIEVPKAPEVPLKKEEPTGIKPAQPTPVEAKPPKPPAPIEDPEEILLDAAWNGDIQACNSALRYASPSTRDQNGFTPLHLAAERDHLAIAMLLLDSSANPNARANGGRTPLHLAARYASAALVELLVDDAHADPNARTTDGRTPLHYAASVAEDGDDEKREVIRVLRDWKADPTIKDNKGRTARDVAQRRDFWDVSATLRRAEKRWEEEHHQNWFQRHGLKR
ncbi:hypothetical protein FCOIX_3534 [Fusarium coicis]|nr:hypothetical protein FCOIX_3534 [Fusarium coicis]